MNVDKNMALSIICILLVISLYIYMDGTKKELENKILELNTKVNQNKDYSDNSLEEFSNSIVSLNATLTTMHSQLSLRVTALENDFNDFEEQYSGLAAAYEQKNAEMERLQEDLLDLNADIEEKMFWYESNSFISDEIESELEYALQKIDLECSEEDINEPNLNVPCLAHFLGVYGYEYVDEKEEDHIKSISEFVYGKGGDCEDWTLFVRAYLNDFSPDYNALILATEKQDSTFWIYQNTEGGGWVFHESGPLYIYNLDEKNYYGICYFYVGTDSGHCIIAISEGEFIEDGDITFDPQNGWHNNNIVKQGGKTASEFFIDEGDGVLNPIQIVITNNDIYVWNEDKLNWLSYGTLKDKTDALIE